MGCGAASRPVSDLPPEKPVAAQAASTASIPTNTPMKVSVVTEPAAVEDKGSSADKDYTQIINKECSLVRLDFCKEMKTIPIVGKKYDLTLQYCYVSQKGYYPNALGKANQDSYVVCESLLGDKSCNFFGIFDGHGEYGDYCSFYTADKLPRHLANELKSNGGLKVLDQQEMTEVYTKAFLNTNFGLHSSKIDDSLSGTTAVTIIQRGDKLLVANVGDSRAIIASEVDGKLKYSPLSIDQTPYRKDERERLKKAGARIMTMDQLEGNEPMHENYGTELGEEIDEGGDPPRVWDSTLERPGCAFSRSVGDAVAKKVGVTAEPEILEWELTPKDKFAVIASDGVFEFITSQHVVDMINKHTNKVEAAKQVVAEAYRLWLTYDDRTDDISIIILIFDNMKQKVAQVHGSPKSSMARMSSLSRALSSENLLRENNRPVRKVLSKARRKDISDDWNKQESSMIDFDHLENTKTEEEIARLSEIVSTSFMFQHLSPIQKDLVYTVMQSRDVEAGELIIKEGEKGDEMYIVDRGHFVVYKADENGQEEQVFQYTEPGSAFGELSLMYGKPRGASVIAKTEGKLWCIGRAAFRAVMMKDENEALLDIFQTIPVLNELPIPALQRLCSASKEMHFQKGELIVEERTVDSSPFAFCVIITGVIALIPMDEGNKKRQLRAELSYLSFAEIGTKFRHAIADNDTKISCIPKLIYREILGERGTTSMKDTVLKSKSKGKRLQAVKSPFLAAENQFLAKYSEVPSYQFDHAFAVLGEFGYAANFKQHEQVHSLKVFAKGKANKARMDKRIVQERNYLAVFSNILKNATGIPFVSGTYQDDKWAYLVFRDQFVCDLSLAINSQAIVEEDAKVYFIASLYSAIRTIHRLGLIHRLVNPSSIYITRGGNIKLVDFRFAKRMDGAHCFTICGDPLYFAPEIVLQQGYDYSADLWAFGIIIYELFEGNTPFGSSETDETSIFQAISKYRPSKLSFTPNKTPENARALLMDILQFSSDTRAGYQHEEHILDAEFFLGIDWDDLQNHRGYPVDIQPTIDLASSVDLSSVSSYVGTAFEQF